MKRITVIMLMIVALVAAVNYESERKETLTKAEVSLVTGGEP